MAETLRPIERFELSMQWQEPDRVPIQIYLTPEAEEKLERHFAGKDILVELGVDLRKVAAPYRGKIKEPKGEIFYDVWGAGYKKVAHQVGGTYDEAVELPLAELETMDDVENYPWPDPDAYDYDAIPDLLDACGDYVLCCGGAGTPDIVNGVSRGRGMEQVVIDIATRDEVGLAIIQKRCDILYEVMKRTLEAGKGRIRVLCLGEDMGNQNGRMFSPKDFDEVFRPRIKRFYDLAHEYGAWAMMHSCGDTHEIQPTLIDMGLDILDAMQPEPKGMDPETIRAACRGKLAFCGLISTQQTLPFGTEEDCRREARHRLDVIAPGGGYIFAPAHQIQPDTPLENILAVFEEATGRSLR